MRDFVLLYINGQRHEVRGMRAFQSLSDFLRYDIGLIGTKVVCAEGDCGSCTVFLGRQIGGSIQYRTVCSCIQFLYQLDCTHVVTIEGLKYDGLLNPIQEAMVGKQGTQCGFCTPGFVVSMFAMFEECNPHPTTADVKNACIGNLCRCTGYQSILQAGLSVDGGQVRRLAELYPQSQIAAELEECGNHSVTVVADGKSFCKPASIAEACAFRRDHPSCTIISGGTDIGVQLNKCLRDPRIFLSLSGLQELRNVSVAGEEIIAGALVSIAELEKLLRQPIPEFSRLLHYFGSPPIKSAGTIGGNIANGSPIADSLPALYVLDAEVELTGVAGSRRVNINEFYTGYKRTVLLADELITGVRIPVPQQGDIFKLYKVSKRKDLDISAFTAAIWMRRSGSTITEARLAYGGVGPNVIRLAKTEAFFVGRSLTEESVRQAGEIARGEIAPISDVRGSAAFRFQLGQNILRKFFAEVSASNGNGDRRTGH